MESSDSSMNGHMVTETHSWIFTGLWNSNHILIDDLFCGDKILANSCSRLRLWIMTWNPFPWELILEDHESLSVAACSLVESRESHRQSHSAALPLRTEWMEFVQKTKAAKKLCCLSDDGAPCYKGLCKQHKVLLRQCNHSKGVFSVWRYVKGRGHIRVHTGSLDAYWTLMKDGIPKSLSSHCAGKPNPKLWKYIKIQQWRWEMGLSKTGRQLAMLWKRRDFNSHPFWTQNPVRVNEPSEFSDFLGWSFWTWNMHAAMAKKNIFLKSWAGDRSGGVFMNIFMGFINQTY